MLVAVWKRVPRRRTEAGDKRCIVLVGIYPICPGNLFWIVLHKDGNIALVINGVSDLESMPSFLAVRSSTSAQYMPNAFSALWAMNSHPRDNSLWSCRSSEILQHYWPS